MVGGQQMVFGDAVVLKLRARRPLSSFHTRLEPPATRDVKGRPPYKSRCLRLVALVSMSSVLAFVPDVALAASLVGELRQWHDIQVNFTGPETRETADPNPFLTYRLNVTFTHGNEVYVVPGYFAADGNAANSGATAGHVWRVDFVPDATGTWTYKASFRNGPEVAVSLDPNAGVPVAFDGEAGHINVGPADRASRPMLEYVGKHYLRIGDTGKYYVMAGNQDPENFLGYYQFDNTQSYAANGGFPHPDQLHHYDAHVRDWRPGDPTWRNGEGKGIIGALNYMASKGLNTQFMLTNNDYSDGFDTNPWIAYDQYTRYDVSKLGQWGIVFSHMDRLGMQAMLLTQKQSGEQMLGKMSIERKLYYRELIARFAHHRGIIWDLDEEMDRWRYFSTQDIEDICNYIKALDPYKHPVQYVQWKGELMADNTTYGRLLGFRNFDSVALQSWPETLHYYTLKWLDESDAAGHPWLVHQIEMNPGILPDSQDYWHDKARKMAIWGNYMAGGTGVLFYGFERSGDTYLSNNRNLEDYRRRDHFFDLIRYAHDFVVDYLPIPDTHHADELTPLPNDYVLAKPGEVYAVYLPDGGTTTLNLAGVSGNFEVKWYNPRAGGALRDGTVRFIQGGGSRSLGEAPVDVSKDWAVLIRTVETH